MKYFVIPALAIAIVLALPAKSHDPVRIVSQKKIVVMFNDHEAAVGIRAVIENRLFKDVAVTVNCGVENDEQVVTLSPRTQTTVDIEMTVVVPNPVCKISAYKYKD